MEKTNNVVLKGDYEEAVYKLQFLPEYENNPFLEALPPIFNEDDVLDRFMVTPRISMEDKQKDVNIRYHVLKRVKNFIQPLPIHFEVERRLSTLIRRGYLARNPWKVESMNSKDIKLKSWPFDKGARVKLEWIGAPFRYEKKVVLPVYFSGKVNGYYKTEKLIVDWTVLTSLVIQHYYVDGIITKPIAPNQTEEITITIEPNKVGYFEKEYLIRGMNVMEKSQTFVVEYNGERFYLPLIEVIRGIIAPNAFLLNCLFEMNSLPVYFTEQREPGLLRLHFTSSYNAKYLKNEYLHHLVWLLMNNNVRKVFENMSGNFHFNNSLKFEWPFQKPIKLKLNAKKTATGYTVLNIKAMLEKELQVSNLEISHPSLVHNEKSNEPRKRIILPLSNSDGYEVDSTVDGRTNEFDEVVTDTLTHEYIDALLITRQRNISNKQRTGIDNNTKKTVKADANSRSMGDIGGTNILRGLEVKALENTYVNGELADFKEVLNELSREDEAHLFASEFLMPVQAFTEDVSKINKVSNPDAYRELKEKWLVSLQAMAMRARNLELITHQQFRYFFMSINKNGYRKEEPLDAVLPIEKPMKVRSIFQLILEKKIIDLEQLTEELKVDIKFLAIITGIEEEFFAKYLDNNQQSFSINDLRIIK